MIVLALGSRVSGGGAAPAQPSARPAPRRVLPPLPAEPPISFRPFVDGHRERVRRGRHVHGGVRQDRTRRFSAAASRWPFTASTTSRSARRASSRPDERAFFAATARDFGLGIPLTATITPLEITAGYRFRPRSCRAASTRTWAAGIDVVRATRSSRISPTRRESRRRAMRGWSAWAAWSSASTGMSGISADVQLSRTSPGSSGRRAFPKMSANRTWAVVSARIRLIVGRELISSIQ